MRNAVYDAVVKKLICTSVASNSRSRINGIKYGDKSFTGKGAKCFIEGGGEGCAPSPAVECVAQDEKCVSPPIRVKEEKVKDAKKDAEDAQRTAARKGKNILRAIDARIEKKCSAANTSTMSEQCPNLSEYKKNVRNEFNNYLQLVAAANEALKNADKERDACYKNNSSTWSGVNNKKCAKENEVSRKAREKKYDELKAKYDFVNGIDKPASGLADYIRKESGERVDYDFVGNLTDMIGSVAGYIADGWLALADFGMSKLPKIQKGDVKNSKREWAALSVFASNIFSLGNIFLATGTTVLFLAGVPFAIPSGIVLGISVPLVYTVHAIVSEPDVTAGEINKEVAAKSSTTSAAIGIIETVGGAALLMILSPQRKASRLLEIDITEKVNYLQKQPKKCKNDFDKRNEVPNLIARNEYKVPGALVATPNEQNTYENSPPSRHRTQQFVLPCTLCHRRHFPEHSCSEYMVNIADWRYDSEVNIRMEILNRNVKKQKAIGASEAQRVLEESQKVTDKKRLVDEQKRIKKFTVGLNLQNKRFREENAKANKNKIAINNRQIKENDKYIEKLGKEIEKYN
jgi:hypothetical protein